MSNKIELGTDGPSASVCAEKTLSQYRSRLSGTASDVREFVALIDFHIRIVYTLAVSESHKSKASPIRILAMPGFGAMLAAVSGRGSIDVSTNPINERILTLAKNTKVALDQFKVPKRYATFKTMRDQLSHGHPLPSDKEVIDNTLDSLRALEQSLTRNLLLALNGFSISSKNSSVKLAIKGRADSLDLLGLWQLSESSEALSVYSHYSNDEIIYISASGEITTSGTLQPNSRFTKDVLLERKPTNNNDIGRFLSDLLIDISAFTEDYSKPSYYFGDEAEVGIIFVPWTRSTSDENIPRTDAFRVNIDGRREWLEQKSKEWLGFAAFLRDVSSWRVLARRIGIGLETIARVRNDEEASRLGGSPNDEIRGPSRLREVQDDLAGKNNKDFKLGDRIDESCKIIKPSTAVYFIVGQAGLGKTDVMLSLAIERANEIASSPGADKPLYLFVSSTGRTLASLDDAVNSSLNITKLLSSHSARALCRNGLLVLLIDGFDELLGSSGYENALGSLEPWFRDLAGKGVLVASARSSYYLTQYRRSLASNTSLNVDHTLVELQPWTQAESKGYLSMRDIPSRSLAHIRESDWKVLGVPFFAKAFAAWFDGQHSPDDHPIIFDIVVNQYLSRESSKLDDPQVGELLSADELRKLFAEIAEMMQLGQNREVEQTDLVLCAQQVVGGDNLDSVRPGLTRRLTSLCGLGTSTSDAGTNQFGFAHELLFDCFLSTCFQLKLDQRASSSSFINLLDKSKIGAPVFEWLLEKVDSAESELPKLLPFSAVDGRKTQALSENLGTLWLSIMNKNGGLPPSNRIWGVRLGHIAPSKMGWSLLEIRDCVIEHLEVPALGTGKIKISKCEIDLLTCASTDELKEIVSGLQTCKILTVHIGGRYGGNPTEVREILQKCGVVSELDDGEISVNADAATHYLERLSRRPDVQVVVFRDTKIAEPEDPRLTWTAQFGDAPWRTFVDQLVECSLARWEPMATSGKSKVRLILGATPKDIMASNLTPEIAQFWSKLQ